MLRRAMGAVVLVVLVVSALVPGSYAVEARVYEHISPLDGDGGRLRASPDSPVANIHAEHDHDHGGHHATLSAQATCDKDINRRGRIYNLRFVAAQDNQLCDNADIDAYQAGGRSYVVQAGGQEAAYTHTDVSNPFRPIILKRYQWSGSGTPYTQVLDVKTFRRGSRWYVAMGLERVTSAGYCGVVIVDITSPASPVKKSQYIGSDWCDTHNVFVEEDADGNGAYLYATANYTRDMRVLDISGRHGGTLGRPKEIGRYRAPTAGPDNFVHDVTVVNHGGSIGSRAYLSYWRSGLVILNARDVTPGSSPRPLVGPNVIDSSDFRTHHAVPNAAGTRVFVQDEYLHSSTSRPVQLWNISNIPSRKPTYLDGIKPNVGVNGQLLPTHNVHVYGNTVYLAWYKAGLQAWRFSDSGIGARVRYHQVQTESADTAYDGSWGLRLLTIGGVQYAFQSDGRYGLIVSSLDTRAPSVSAPTHDIAQPAALGSGTVPVSLRWSATDPSGVALYQLQQSTDGGAYYSLQLSSSTARSLVRSLTPGHSYRFRVRATDRVGNTSGWRYGPAFRVELSEETSGAIAYAGDWRAQALRSASGGQVKYAKAGTAEMTLRFTGSDIAWISARSSLRGEAVVYVDGTYVRTVDLYSAAFQARLVVFTRSWPAPGDHTLTVRVIGTAGRPRVDVDAFVVLR